MAAETGSGKTGAFCIPILQSVWETLKDFESGKTVRSVASAQSCKLINTIPFSFDSPSLYFSSFFIAKLQSIF